MSRISIKKSTSDKAIWIIQIKLQNYIKINFIVFTNQIERNEFSKSERSSETSIRQMNDTYLTLNFELKGKFPIEGSIMILK